MPHPPRAHPTTIGTVFSVHDALAAGVTREELRRPELLRPFHGVRVIDRALVIDSTIDPAPELRRQVVEHARAFVPRLRSGEFFSHTTALLAHGCPIRCAKTLHVSAPPPFDRNRSKGVVGHRYTGNSPAHHSSGLPVASPALSLFQSASLLSLREMVVAIDHLIVPRMVDYYEPEAGPSDALTLELSTLRGRGNSKLRLAQHYARVGAESRMETLTRLILAAYRLDHHFETQVELVDSQGRIGRFDLVSKRHRVVVEYDGEQHRTNRTQYLKDLKRLERARALGYRVVRLHWEDVLRTPRRAALEIAGILGVPARPSKHHALLIAPR